MAVSSDGKLLATASNDTTIRVWDMQTGREKMTLTGHTDKVTFVLFTPDNKKLVSVSNDSTIRTWDLTTGKEATVIRNGPADEVPTMRLSSDGKTLRVWVSNRTVETYDLEKGERTSSFEGHDRDLYCLTFSTDGSLAALGCVDGTVRFWDLTKEQKVGEDLPAHAERMADVVFTPDKKTLITADGVGNLKIWDFATRKVTKELPKQKSYVIGFAMSSDGKRFASAHMNNVVNLWDVATGKIIRSWDMKVPEHPTKPFIWGMTFTPDNKKIVTANGNTTAFVLDCP